MHAVNHEVLSHQPPRRVLLVEDDVHLADVVQQHLRGEGYVVQHARDGRHGLGLVEAGLWHAVILDLMLPGVDGLEICRRARDHGRWMPIIVVSARGSEVHRILGLEMGADDYLPKPFSVLELLTRLKALLRRVDALDRDDSRGRARTLSAGDLHIDRLARQARLGGRELDLTPREFDLLLHFATHPGRVFTRVELLDQVWGARHDGYEHTVNSHINRLRAKMEDDPRRPQRIVTVWGQGYKLAWPPAEVHSPAHPATDLGAALAGRAGQPAM